MRKISRQRAYERVREHFSRPGAQYGTDKSKTTCQYRGNHDPKSPQRCAVGVLVSNTAYAKNKDFESEFSDDALSLSGYDIVYDELADFMADMQQLHDSMAMPSPNVRRKPVKEFVKALDRFAENRGLKVVNG